VSKAVEGLTSQDLDAEQATALPERHAMSKIDIGAGLGIDNFAMPINEAIAINNQSVASVAVADADQTVIIGQESTEVQP